MLSGCRITTPVKTSASVEQSGSIVSSSTKKTGLIKVMIEEGDNYSVAQPVQEVSKGSDAVFDVSVTNSATFVTATYDNYEVTNETHKGFTITLKNIQYPTVVSLAVADEKIAYFDFSEARNPAVRKPKVKAHLKENTINGYTNFTRDGYIPLGWNTRRDYTGTYVPFGSRMPFSTKALFIQWEKETDASLFETTYNEKRKGLFITKYNGHDERVAIPQKINNQEVIGIQNGAITHEELKTLILSKSILYVQNSAVTSPSLETLYFCDNIIHISDVSFTAKIKTVHINAVVPPTYSGTYYDTFPDKIDYLESIKDDKKIVLFSGSSTRYGYVSPLIETEYTDYKVVNMGVFAYVNIKPQLDVITSFTKTDDVILSSPEFDNHCLDYQFGISKEFEYQLFAFFESNYDLLKYVDVSKYEKFFNNFSLHSQIKNSMSARDYSISPKHYDDDENYYASETYNIQGDFILQRNGHPTDEWLSQPIDEYNLDTTITPSLIESLNTVYQSLLDKGLIVYFTFSPKNINCISESTTLYERNRIETYLNENLIVPVISKWENFILPGTCFYLIDNHLSSLAAASRTEQVINDLRPYLTQEE